MIGGKPYGINADMVFDGIIHSFWKYWANFPFDQTTFFDYFG